MRGPERSESARRTREKIQMRVCVGDHFLKAPTALQEEAVLMGLHMGNISFEQLPTAVKTGSLRAERETPVRLNIQMLQFPYGRRAFWV